MSDPVKQSPGPAPGPAVVLLSGGLDSMVTAALAREAGHALHALTIDYGQRHVREIESARDIAQRLGAARHVELPLDLRRFGGSALTDDIDVPKTGLEEG
ncbi:MAG: 7-cyano-7-deazaguanine synthase, partial [Alphaproteobacteria bacterium]|nr:7-cyano-7-deazaguanine synthase [Alphaproteobacteria bacterium]